VIPNGSDLPAEAARDVVRDPDLLATLGRLERYKGHHRVLEAFPHVRARRPGARLWIGGTGPEEEPLRRRAAELGLADCVDVHGIPAEDRVRMARELARVDTVVSLSEFETQPIAALEALALGCKLVVARSPGLAALAEAGLASGVDPGAGPDAVAEAIVEALDRPAAADPPSLPSWDDCADALLALYEQIAAARRG